MDSRYFPEICLAGLRKGMNYVKLVIVATEVRLRRISIISKTLQLGSICSMETVDSNIAYRVFCWAGVAQSV
jgi:hypothetical protein